LAQQAEKDALVKQQAQDELRKLQEEVKRMQEIQAKIAFDNDVLRRQTEAGEAELKAHKERALKEQQTREAVEIQLIKTQEYMKKSVPQPTEAQDPLHTHVLKLENFVYKKGEYICDRCNQRFSGQVYHCAGCRYDLHPDCTLAYIAWKQSQS